MLGDPKAEPANGWRSDGTPSTRGAHGESSRADHHRTPVQPLAVRTAIGDALPKTAVVVEEAGIGVLVAPLPTACDALLWPSA